MNIAKILCLFFLGAICFATFAPAQKASPLVVVQAANTGPAAPAPTPAVQVSSVSEAMKTLQEVKAANDQTLKKQEAVLQKLEDMQKAADQLKIFTHRTGG